MAQKTQSRRIELALNTAEKMSWQKPKTISAAELNLTFRQGTAEKENLPLQRSTLQHLNYRHGKHEIPT
jgi:hypothetical protein